MLHDDQLGHDSLLDGIVFDPVKRSAVVKLLSYEGQEAPERVPIEIVFTGVGALTLSADCEALDDNRGAGNVAYWHIAQDAGVSHFYLVEGYVAITSSASPELRRL
jgi:hypothetical protein